MTLQELLDSVYLDEFNILLERNPNKARNHWLINPSATTPAPATTPARR